MQHRLDLLRAQMEKRGICAYIVPTSDYHDSEYVGEHFKARQYLSGFSGSAGTLVVTMNEAGLWTDARYFLQAQKQLPDYIKLYRMGEPDVPTIAEYLKSSMGKGCAVGFDGRLVGQKWVERLCAQLIELAPIIKWEEDLVGLIWEDRPAISAEKLWELPPKYAGKDSVSEIAGLRALLKERDAGALVITTLDDIAWLLNIRGNDVKYTPVALCYMIVERESAKLFIEGEKLPPSLKERFLRGNITVMPYDAIYGYAGCEKIICDLNSINYSLWMKLKDSAEIIDMACPITLKKAVKNQTETANTRIAHQKDGAALTKFIKWIKESVKSSGLTEYAAQEYLDGLRISTQNSLGLSFETICAYNANGAIVHYGARQDSCAELRASGLLLVDSGGQYLEGTTDVTRTIVLGEITDEQKRSYTLVLRGMIALAKAKFLYGARGSNLDVLARGPLWEHGLDYKHGTGHGVGHVLGVHEGPNGFRWKYEPGINDACVLEEGMITSDEPGLYIEGEYGIRLENCLLCKKAEQNEFGQFMEFETLTLAPLEREAIDPAMLTKDELCWLNEYHKTVCERVGPLLSEDERKWLQERTAPIYCG